MLALCLLRLLLISRCDAWFDTSFPSATRPIKNPLFPFPRISLSSSGSSLHTYYRGVFGIYWCAKFGDSLDDDCHPDDWKEGDGEETRGLEEDPRFGLLVGSEDDSSGLDGNPERR